MVTSFLKFEEKGRFVGPFLFLVLLFIPLPLKQDAQTFLAIFAWVVSNWLLTSIPLYISGLLGITLSVFLGVAQPKEAFSPLADPLIMLFFGGFLFARAFEATGLDRKVSLWVLSHPSVRGRLNRTVFALIMTTGLISMWVSNTATAAMMMPIVLGILKSLDIKDPKAQGALLLSTAYAASIGGIGTPMGTPPNFIVIGMLHNFAGVKLDFLKWFQLTVPVMLVMLFACYHYAMSKLKGISGVPVINEKISWERRDFVVLGVFFTTVFFWFAPSFVTLFLGGGHWLSLLLEKRFEAGVVSVFFASTLFLLPLWGKEKILASKDVSKIDWGSLLLFGTGLSLGQMLFKLGLAELGGEYAMSVYHQLPYVLFLGVVIGFTVFFSEVASNTAAANILLPLIIAAAQKLQIDPVVPALAVGLAASLSFMLPVGTPPNAIAYGTGLVDLKQMMRYGLFLNILSIVLLTSFFSLFQLL